MKGKIKWFNKSKGYGFIIADNNKEYFVHMSQLIKNIYPEENDKVEFIPRNSARGLQAHNVRLLKLKL